MDLIRFLGEAETVFTREHIAETGAASTLCGRLIQAGSPYLRTAVPDSAARWASYRVCARCRKAAVDRLEALAAVVRDPP